MTMLTNREYYIYIHGLPLRIKRRSFRHLETNDINLPVEIQMQSEFIFCFTSQKILKNRYQYSDELTKSILKNCLDNYIDYDDLYVQHDLLNHTLINFLRRCKEQRVSDYA